MFKNAKKKKVHSLKKENKHLVANFNLYTSTQVIRQKAIFLNFIKWQKLNQDI